MNLDVPDAAIVTDGEKAGRFSDGIEWTSPRAARSCTDRNAIEGMSAQPGAVVLFRIDDHTLVWAVMTWRREIWGLWRWGNRRQ